MYSLSFVFSFFSFAVSQEPLTCENGQVLVLMENEGFKCQSADERLLSLPQFQDDETCPNNSFLQEVVDENGDRVIKCISATAVASVSNAEEGECDLDKYRSSATDTDCLPLPLTSSTIDCFPVDPQSGSKILTSPPGYVAYHIATNAYVDTIKWYSSTDRLISSENRRSLTSKFSTEGTHFLKVGTKFVRSDGYTITVTISCNSISID